MAPYTPRDAYVAYRVTKRSAGVLYAGDADLPTSLVGDGEREPAPRAAEAPRAAGSAQGQGVTLVSTLDGGRGARPCVAGAFYFVFSF